MTMISDIVSPIFKLIYFWPAGFSASSSFSS
jgi:hypothetical protein